ncbi:MAG: response regulator [Patescibacteria group bacterium]
MKILIVDNDSSTVTTLQALLANEGAFQIEVAYSGEEGLAKMTATPDYDVVLLDIMMPQISGMDVCRSMIQNPRLQKIPVLLMSSALPIPPNEFHESMEKSSELSVIKGVLEKPFTTSDLLAQIYKVARPALR